MYIADMAAEDEIRQDENRPSTDRSEFQRTPLRIHFRNFGRAFTDFDWFGLFRRKREPPSGSQSDRPAVRESSTWPETKQLSIKKGTFRLETGRDLSHSGFRKLFSCSLIN